MKKDDCIFCKLANGSIPTNTIYEDDMFAVILDAEPVSRGHALIIPKEHYDNLFELGDEEAERLVPLAKKIATKIKDYLRCDGFNLLQNNGETAGQSVFHFHMHLIPRYKNAPNNSALLSFVHAGMTPEEIKEVLKELS